MKANIRIIKRAERGATETATQTRKTENKSARQATRDIAGNVSTWIKEFQHRHTPDPRRAFASLFVDAATTSAAD